jgi:hypothetical protein
MYQHSVRTLEDAFAYIIECQLATVESLAMKKSRGVYDYRRHIDIAQTGLQWLLDFDVTPEAGSRARQIYDKHGVSVDAWAKSFEVS